MSTVHAVDVIDIKGSPVNLADFKGKTLLIVNVASKCGLTPQYEQLEALYEHHQDDGLVVLGFPSNEFAGQEPGAEAEIQTFCQSTYGIKFPMFSKICVNGDERHPLYQCLITAQPAREELADSGLTAKLKEHGLLGSGPASDVMWNFEKFLVNSEGEVTGRFAPDMTVEHPVLAKAIQTELAK